jgi:hypothetical protein
MTNYIYRWTEGNAGPFEIAGSARALYQVAKRLELPIRPFTAALLHEDGSPAEFLAALAEGEGR